MNTNEFLEYSKKLEIAAELKQKGVPAFSGIQWETDVTKVNLSLLASAPVVSEHTLNHPYTKLSIEEVPTKDVHTDRVLNLGAELERFIPLYSLVMAGVKIIPPMAHKTREIVNGEAVEGQINYPLNLSDGAHRTQLAKALNLDTLPVLFVDTVSAFRFGRELYDVQEVPEENQLRFVKKNTGGVFTLDLQDVYPVVDASGDWVFHVQLY